MSSISNEDNSVTRAASSLQRRFLLGAGLAGTGLILELAWGADLALNRFAQVPRLHQEGIEPSPRRREDRGGATGRVGA